MAKEARSGRRATVGSVFFAGVSQLRSLLLGRCPLCYGALSVVMVDSGEEVAIEKLWWRAAQGRYRKGLLEERCRAASDDDG